MNATTKTMKNSKLLRKGESWSKRLDNKTHNIITKNRVVYGELTAMVKLTKSTYIAKLTGGKCKRDSFS